MLDQCCQRLVLVLCLDEIFFRRAPILMAIAPPSMAMVAGQRGPDRSGESWYKVLANWPCVTVVVIDAGKGLERGVKLAREARRTAAEGHEDAAAMPLQMGLDVFHTQRELQRVVHGKWKRAERQLDTATEADHKVAQSKQRGRDARGVAQQARRAWHKAERYFDEAVQTEGVVRRVALALAIFRPDGELNDRQWAQAQLQGQAMGVVGKACAKRVSKARTAASRVEGMLSASYLGNQRLDNRGHFLGGQAHHAARRLFGPSSPDASIGEGVGVVIGLPHGYSWNTRLGCGNIPLRGQWSNAGIRLPHTNRPACPEPASVNGRFHL